MLYRLATVQDIPVLCRIRKQQLIDEGGTPIPGMDEELLRYFTDKLADGSLVEWVLEDGGQIIATAAIAFMDFPPSYTNRTGLRGYITNMYTAPAYRGKGIASSMLGRLKQEAEKRSVHSIMLHASVLGKPVYKQFGFTETNQWMELKL